MCAAGPALGWDVVNVGDKVLFSKYYTPVAVKGMDSVVIMGENNIIAIRKQNENL